MSTYAAGDRVRWGELCAIVLRAFTVPCIDRDHITGKVKRKYATPQIEIETDCGRRVIIGPDNAGLQPLRSRGRSHAQRPHRKTATPCDNGPATPGRASTA